MTALSSAPPLQLDAEHPWPGLASYDEHSESFFRGRDDETAEMLRRVGLAPLTVLYGSSGLGKSSLLQAGLFPRLRAGPYFPVYVRIDFSAGAEASPDDQIAARLETEAALHGAELPPRAEGESLWEWLHRPDFRLWSPDNRPLVPVFALDQFEEVFTRTAGDTARRAGHLATLANLIENRVPPSLADDRARRATLDLLAQPYRVVLSFREDFLPDFDGWKDQLPALLRNRYRLLPMSREQATRAVAAAGAAVLAPGIATEIVDFVARGSVAAASGGVEPVLLSLCCERLNRRRAPGTQIDAALLREAGDNILDDFYAEALEGLPPRVARFIETQLVQGDRYRGSYPRDEALARGDLAANELAGLTDRYRLLRVDQQADVARIELIHDRLVPVVSRARERRAAAEREQAEREAREAAEREAAEQAARREEAEAAQARMRRMRNLSMGALVAVVVLAILGAWAALQANRARNEALTMQSELQRSFDDQQRLLATTRSAERAASAAVDQERKAREETVHQGRVARARELIAHALQQAPLDTELSALLAAEALKTAPLPEAQDALSKALSSWHQERRIEVGGALVRMAALGDGRFAVAAADGSLSFVTPASGKVQALGRLEGQPAGTTVVDSGRIVVAWGAKGAAPVAAAWDVSNGRLLWRRTLGALSGSACCARLLELGNERVQLIDARTGAPVVELKVDFLHTAAFSADGRSFVTVGGWRDPARPLSCLGSELQRHDSADGHLLGAPVHSGEGDGTWALAPEGGGAIVSSRGPAEHCSGYREQATWVTASGRSVGLGGSPGRLQLVRVQGGRAALASGPMTQIWLLSASDGSSEPTARIGGSMLHGADVRALAWQGDESGLIASADAAGVLRAWATQYDGPPRPLVVLAAGHGPTDVAFNRDRLVSIGNDGTLRVWTLPDLRPFAEPAKPGIPCLRCKSPEDWLVESRRRIGRDFNAEERRRFAISESGTAAAVTASAPSAISQRTEQAP